MDSASATPSVCSCQPHSCSVRRSERPTVSIWSAFRSHSQSFSLSHPLCLCLSVCLKRPFLLSLMCSVHPGACALLASVSASQYISISVYYSIWLTFFLFLLCSVIFVPLSPIVFVTPPLLFSFSLSHTQTYTHSYTHTKRTVV